MFRVRAPRLRRGRPGRERRSGPPLRPLHRGSRWALVLAGALPLALACGLSGLAPWSAPWSPGAPEIPGPGRDLGETASALLTRAIRYDTTNPPGNERPLAEFFAEVLRDRNLEARVVETPSEGAPEGRAALWARYPGRGEGRPLVLLSHLDVVPANPEDWRVDPFGGHAVGDTIVGRGALDAKGVAVVHLLTLAELARRETPLERDVLMLAVPDEELGGRRGAGYVARERPELLGDAAYLLTEGGSIQPGREGRPEVWGVAVGEKSPCWLALEARGAPGHGSAAREGGAVPRLVEALHRLRSLDPRVRVLPEVARMFAELAPLAPPDDRADYAELRRALREEPSFRRRFLADAGRRSLVQNTLNVTVLEGSRRTNVIPPRARAEIDARLLPGRSCEAFRERVTKRIDDPSVELETLLSFQSRPSPIETPLYRAIERAAEASDSPSRVVPRVIAGFTDAHWFRGQGLTAYGFVPRWLEPEDTRGIHGPNESISIANLKRGVRTLVRIVERLDETAPPAGEDRRGAG